jgi:hypothetical protein
LLSRERSRESGFLLEDSVFVWYITGLARGAIASNFVPVVAGGRALDMMRATAKQSHGGSAERIA